MAFNGNGLKLVGDDGKAQKLAFGSEINGDGSTPLPVGLYLIIAVAGSSGFPAPAGTGSALAAGNFIEIATGVTVTPAIGDNVVEVTGTDLCDITSLTMEWSKPEINTTVLCDNTNKYRAGKGDMAGTMEGIFVVGTTDASDGPLREFIDIVQQDAGTSADVYAQQENIQLGRFYVNNNVNIADYMYVIAPFQRFGQSAGGAIGDAQTFSSPFRFASLNYTTVGGTQISLNPTFYRLGS